MRKRLAVMLAAVMAGISGRLWKHSERKQYRGSWSFGNSGRERSDRRRGEF